jgi:hypothetical protein
MRKFLCGVTLAAVTALQGCAVNTDDFAGQPGAAAALAKCRLEAYQLPITANPAASPFTVAAMQNQYLLDCMKAAGYQPN